VTQRLRAAEVSTRRFELGRRLGHGEMGVVYEAYDRERGRSVALKVYRHDDEVTLARVRRIVERLRGMRHVNVVEVIDLIEDGAAPMLVMERVDGEDMMSYVAGRWRSEASELPGVRGIRCDVGRLRSCLAQIASGLIELHRRGVLHRDLKPANLRLTPEGRLVILDFSLSDDHRADAGPGGSIGYMAPEQAIADAAIGPAADWYSVGVIAYEALTGQLPFDGPPQRVLQDKAHRAPVPVDTVVAGAPVDLVELCGALVVPDPERRPRDEELARRLGLAEPMPRIGLRAVPGTRRARAVERVLERLRVAADRGRAASIALVGESGIGGGAALAGVADAARAQWPDAVVLSIDGARGLLDGLGAALAVVWSALGDGEQRAIVPGKVAALTSLLPALAAVPVLADGPPPLARAEHARATDAIDALREVLTLLSRRRTVVILIDDLDEAEDDARTVLADALRGPDHPPVLLVGRCVDEARLPAIERLVPFPLEWSSRAEIEALLAEREVPPATVTTIIDRCDGNRALAIELARAWELGEDAPAGGLVAVLGARIARLPAAASDLLIATARLGGVLPLAALGRVLDLDAATAADAVAMLERRGLAMTELGALLPLRRPVRAALAATIDPRRAARVARSLAAAADDLPPGVRARLWHEAGDDVRAADDALLAAEHARGRLRFAEAMALYRLAVTGGRCDLWPRLAECAAAAGQGAIAARAYAAAAERAGGDAAARLAFEIRAAEHHVLAGEVDDGIERFRRALASIDIGLAASPARALPRLLARRAWLRVRGIRFDPRTTVDVAPFALACADACLSATYHLGVLETVIGAELQARTLALALRLGEAERLGRAAVLESIYLTSQGAIARAERLVAMARHTADELGSPELASFALLGVAGFEFFHRNRFASALALFDSRIRTVLAEPEPEAWSLDMVQTYACMALTHLGDIHELTRRVGALIREAERRGDQYAASTYRVRCNLAWLARGDVAGADEALAIAERQWPFDGARFRVPDYFRMYARIERALWGGDGAAAARAFAAGIAPLERSMLTRVHHVRAETDSLGARVAIATAAPGQARAAARPWLTRLRRTATGLGPLWSALLTGCAALRDGAAAAAVAPLREALERAEVLSLGLHAAAARLRLADALGRDNGTIDRALHDLARLGVTAVPQTIAMIAP